jgi:hypothetical protein
MNTYKLRSGYTVTTARTGNAIEFVTRNERGEAVSTVNHSFAEAVPLVRKLVCGAR